MKYIHLLCLQAMPNEPAICDTEFDENGFENRRVEIWRSGRARDKPYLAVEIIRAEFENHWNLALRARDEYKDIHDQQF